MTQALPVARVSHARLNDAERLTFLSALARTGSVAASARAINRPRSTLHSATKMDSEFQLACESAQDEYVATLLKQAHKLAVDGVSTPIFDKDGIQRGEKIRYSERVLLTLLARRDPDFAPKTTVELTGKVEVEHTLGPETLALMAPAARIEVRRALLLQRADTLSDSARQSELLAIHSDAVRDGVDFNLLESARRLRIGKLAEVVEADFEEVETVPTDEELRALIPI